MSVFSVNFSEDKVLNIAWNEFAKQSNGSITVKCGETIVLVTSCMSSQSNEEQNFLPLSVEYLEKTYAIGKIPGGFVKREGKPKDSEVITARVIDRSIRPLFPKELTNEIQVIAMVLSSDGLVDPDILAINGASFSLYLSDIPFDYPIGAVRVCKSKDKFLVNPNYKEKESVDSDLIIVGTEDKIVMLEGQMNQIKEEDVIKSIEIAMPYIKNIIDMQKRMRGEFGKDKIKIDKVNLDEVVSKVKNFVYDKLEHLYGLVKKEDRQKAIDNIVCELKDIFKEELTQEVISENTLLEIFYSIDREFVREKILNESIRPDNRGLEDIRPIECKVGVLPRTHGSAIFTRGQTQSLAITTLGTSSDEQIIEALEGEKLKKFMLHYFFPPFSTGEVKPLRGPSRREIGHGNLAERGLMSVIPSKEEFPYTIRVVSEILESNGSSSMATVCAASLSLMDAGVPISNSVAGISIGLVKEEDRYKILTDIAGIEDHYGDMDFKVAGTKYGITAIQLDIKIKGLEIGIIEEALYQARRARLSILEKMDEVLSTPRSHISEHAPRIKSFKVDIDKIGNIIGPGGKIIRKLIKENNVSIDIDDEEGIVSVVAHNDNDLNRAINQIMGIIKDVQVGDVYEVKVVQITNFGAFCELFPGKVGLLHISELSEKFVRDIRQLIKEGDIIKARVINIDNQGRINLSIKQL